MKIVKIFLLISLAFAFCELLSGSKNAEKFTIRITRDSVKDNLLLGSIYLNSELIGTTYENFNLKIEKGTYTGLMRYNSGKNFVQSSLGKMSHKGDFLLEVSGVPKRTNILLHGGNQPYHSEGCILLGAVEKKLDGTGYITNDHPLRKLRMSFYGTDNPIACPNKEITIEIVDHFLNPKTKSKLIILD